MHKPEGPGGAAPPVSYTHLDVYKRQERICIPTSFYERDGHHYYNSLAFVGDDGQVQGVYRKSHIPDGPGYQEKYYFRPGDTGFKVWSTRFGRCLLYTSRCV